MVKKFVISAEISGVDKYISELVPATGGKKAVGNYCLKKEEAVQYDNLDAVYKAIQNIHNLQDRDFTIDSFYPSKPVGRQPKEIDKSLK